MIFKKIGIVGLGFMGGSLGLAIKQKNLASSVVGVSRSQNTIDQALEQGVIDEGLLGIDESLHACDLIILCTPVKQIMCDIERLSSLIDSQTIVSDVGSTKQKITEKGYRYLKRFIGVHPLAGSEKSGITYANKSLFDGCSCVIALDSHLDKEQVMPLETFWTALGAKVFFLTSEEHDRIIAYTSHLPHLVASSLIQSSHLQSRKILVFASKGYWDTTRIASGTTASMA